MTASVNIKVQDSLLPLFSVKTDIGHLNESVGVLLDSGCQRNFILESLANRLKLVTVGEKFSLQINGFTGEQKNESRFVLFPIVINDKTVNLECLCLPTIPIKFSTPYMSELLEILKEDNRKLAYEPYYDAKNTLVSGIQCLIGATDWHLVANWPITLIGNPECKQSSYYTVNDKIVPLGSVELFIQNYKYEKERNQSFDHSGSVDVTTNILRYNINDDNDSYSCMNNINMVSSFDSRNSEIDNILDIAEYVDLNEKCNTVLNLNQSIEIDENKLSELEVTKFVMENSTENPSGRFTMAIPWQSRFKSALKSNERLARKVLSSVQKKYSNKVDILVRTDEVFKKQLASKMIERVSDLDQYKQIYPRYSFLSHFPLVKEDRQTTKIRVIYMANLAEKNKDGSPGISLNQTIHPGFGKNSKIATAFSFARFDKHLLCFDISKAYHQLAISDDNSSKFLFFWFKDVAKGDFSPIVYRCSRVIFGMSVSPFLLTCALNKILIQEGDDPALSKTENDKLNYLKQQIYHGAYVDNLFVGGDTQEDLHYIYDNAVRVFNKHQFPLQQFMTNNMKFQTELDNLYKETTPNTVKILGMYWHRDRDTVSAPNYKMDLQANTKRKILSEINSNFDLMGTKIPLLNRAKLFLHKLQMDTHLNWDNFLSHDDIHEWKKIAKQFNHYKSVEIPRYVGSHTAKYDLCLFTDASKNYLGFASYLKNNDTNQVSYLMAGNRMLDRVMRCRSIPVLEFAAIEYAVQKGLDLYLELTTAVVPINIVNIRLFSDNTVALSWLHKSEILLTKMQKRSIYVNNRLQSVVKMCGEVHSIGFSHIGTTMNSADFLTRSFSQKRLSNTNFITGPSILKEKLDEIDWITVPNPHIENDPELPQFAISSIDQVRKMSNEVSELIDISRFSSLILAIKTVRIVKRFITKLKTKLYLKDTQKYAHLEPKYSFDSFADCKRLLIREDQRREFPELIKFFNTKQNVKRKIPSLVSQMNLVLDDQLIKVKSKMGKSLSNTVNKFPLLLSNKSQFMKLAVLSCHKQHNHSGIYYILNQLRREYFILKAFSAVKQVVKQCVHCKRHNSRSVKVNANEYRSFMVNTKQRLFDTVFIDYAGPIMTKMNGKSQKTYLVIFKCFWSKAINVEVVTSMDTKGFLLAFQNHIYEFGLPQIVHADAGSNFQSGFNWLREILDTVEMKDYFDQWNVQTPSFNQYPRGSLKKGIPGFIESGVKQIKRLIQGSIKNNILDFEQFLNVVKKCVCLANKRPLTNHSALRDQSVNSEFRILTPEILKFGYETNILEVNVPQADADEWQLNQLIDHRIAYKNVAQLVKVKNNIREGYYTDFLYALMDDATHLKGRYLPIKHQVLKVGDTVLIKDPFLKSDQFPLGLVTQVTKNELKEVTQVSVRKANKMTINRDVSDIILLVSNELSNDESHVLGDGNIVDEQVNGNSSLSHSDVVHSDRDSRRRSAAVRCERINRSILQNC